jgi:hypothetical protein
MQVPMTAALRLNRRKVSIISSSCYASVEALAFTTDRRTNGLLVNSMAEPILTTRILFNTFPSIPSLQYLLFNTRSTGALEGYTQE